MFGDNLLRIGYGGQARVARGEMNAIGIVTKASPSTYFTDTAEDFNASKQPIVQAFVILAQHLRNGHDVVWPKDGVGTGLVQLNVRAPEIADAIERCRIALFSMANDVIEY